MLAAGLRKALPVIRQSLRERLVHLHALIGLAEQAGQCAEIFHIMLQHMGALRGQTGGDGGRADVGIAVHVAADPGGEAEQLRQRRFHVVDRLQRLRQRFVHRRHDAIDGIGQIKPDVVVLVLHGGPYRRGFGGLPAGRQRHVNTVVVLAALLRRARGIEIVDQRPHDRLLFFQ